MIRFILLMTSTLVLLTGCSNLPLFNRQQSPSVEQQQTQKVQLQFAEAIDHYLSQNDLKPLKQLAKQQPADEWSVRARQLTLNIEQQQQALEASDEFAKNCQQESIDLKGTMEQLKQLLIDMELREE